MIDFTRAFNSAWERMVVILFQPFDLGKWFVIGFSAFLAGLLHGGNGFNTSFNSNNLNKSPWNNSSTSSVYKTIDWSHVHSTLNNAVVGLQISMIILIVVLVFVVVFGLTLLIYWLGSRGQFMFLDNLVRNRGAISVPWTYYARQGNSLFGFYLLYLLITFLALLPFLVVTIVLALPFFQQHRWPGGGEIAGFIGLGLINFALGLFFTIVLFVFREFGVPLMFRNGLLARPAFWATINLFKVHTGSVVVFVLLRFALFLGLIVLSYIACCMTLCLSILPYLGTIFLLPVLVYIRCFSLDCLAQFGPEYDVWTVDVPQTAPVATAPLSPPPPPV